MIYQDNDGCITLDYLEYVIKQCGENKHILQTNCNGNPLLPHDYVIDHGTAQEILEKLKQGIKTSWI